MSSVGQLLNKHIVDFSSIKDTREGRLLQKYLNLRALNFIDTMPYYDIRSGQSIIDGFFISKDDQYKISTDTHLVAKTYKISEMKYDDFLDIRNRYLLGLDLKSYKDIGKVIKDVKLLDKLPDEDLGPRLASLMDGIADITERYNLYTSIYEKTSNDLKLDIQDRVFELVDDMMYEEVEEGFIKGRVQQLQKHLASYARNFTLKPRIIKLHAFYIKDEFLTIITDNYLTKLTTVLTESPYEYQKDAIHYMYLISEIVTFLHEINYIHGNLSLDAFSVITYKDGKHRIFLNDIGYNRRGDSARVMPRVDAFIPYGNRFTSLESDIYSLGMTFLQVLSPAIVDDWANFHPQGGNPPRFLNIYPPLQELLDSCFEKNPENRPLAFQVTDILEYLYNNIPPSLTL